MSKSRRNAAVMSLVVCLAVSTISVAPAIAQTGTRAFPDAYDAARAAATDVMKAAGATSISLALVDGRRTLWSTTVGVVDEAGTKPTASTLYGTGSVSKMITAISVMQLVDAGKVSLDAPVTDYVTDFRMASPEYRQITVRMLLDHSAGLPGTDYSNGLTEAPFPGYPQQVLESLATSRLKTTPGAMSVYCNDCFTLAGILVERMSGLSYTDYVDQRILTPLGMDLSRYPTAPVPAPGSYAPVITDAGVLPGEIINLLATGGLMSTPDEMGRLASMIMNGGTLDGVRILSPRAVAEMGRSQVASTLTAAPPTFRYGLGWDSVTEPGLDAAGVHGWVKGGDTTQYHAAFTVAPDDDLAAVVLGAGTGLSAGKLEAVAQRMILTALAERGTIDAVPAPLTTNTPPTVSPTPTQTRDIAGIYLSQGTALRVTPRPNGALRLALLTDGEWVEQPGTLTRRTDGQYWPTGSASSPALGLSRGWGRTFLILSKPAGMGHYLEHLVVGQKVTSIDQLSPAWQQRLGETWLNVNDHADSYLLWKSLPTLTLTQIPGLPGILWVADPFAPSPVNPGASDDLASMFLTVPIIQGRDLNDLEVLHRPDGEWMRFGGALYRPLSSVPALAAGSSDVTISPDGYAEWRTAPAAGTVTIRGNGSWKAYSADGSLIGSQAADGADVSVPAGARLALFGPMGSTLQVHFIPTG